jgi:hypothetical protein
MITKAQMHRAGATFMALALTVPMTSVMAGDNYLTLGFGFVGTACGIIGCNPNPLLKTFTPNNVFTGEASTRQAVLQLDASAIATGKNEVYVNPPNKICTNDTPHPDPNQTSSVGRLTNGFNHIVFASNMLVSGKSNTIMFCARDASGNVPPIVDDYQVNDIVLHYQTN